MIQLEEQHAVQDTEQCVNKTLLTYVDYPFNGQRCFSYPQYVYEKGVFTPIGKAAFPDEGCLPMVVDSSYSLDDLESMYGRLVIMNLSTSEIQENRYYPINESSRYNGIINPSRPHSMIEFTKLSQHGLSSVLMQVVDIQERVSFERPFDDPVHLGLGQALPQTNYILVSQVDNGRKLYYGPFEYSIHQGDRISLEAASDTDFERRISGVDEANLEFSIDLCDQNEDTKAVFVSAEEFRQQMEHPVVAYDWISDSELIDALGRIALNSDVDISKSQMKRLKTAISRYKEEMAKIGFSEERRDRMVALVEGYADWQSLPERMKSQSVENIPTDQLAAYVLSDDHFRDFYEKVIENDQVKEKVARAESELMRQLQNLKLGIEQAAQEKSKLETKVRLLEERHDEVVEGYQREAQEQIERRNQEIEEKRAEAERLEAELDRLKRERIVAEEQIDSIIESMGSGFKGSEKILENIVIRRIIESVAPGVGAAQAISCEPTPEQRVAVSSQLAAPVIRDDESSMGDEEVVGVLESGICEGAGRDYDRNEVINLLTCLMQGYVVTLAGMPGTGKTSLANILADVLGVSAEGANRFCEVSVEKGWTSYKDFIGYYNPFTKTLERANAAVFDAFSGLDAEARSAVVSPAPYLFLLDEANLSSIEHYWSPFLRTCDTFRRQPSRLSLGGPDDLIVPPWVRFIATVNFDHTTEELSPRFLDRSWVITLDPQPIDFMENDVTEPLLDYAAEKPFSYEKLMQVFGVRQDDVISSKLRAKTKEVFDVFAKHGSPLSRRSQSMIRDYLGTTSRLMNMSTAEAAYAPVDFAVAQKLLPSLNGPAERLESLLNDLAGVGGLGRTTSRIEHMLKAGQDSGYYQYFA
ncbi:hypothetical protein [Adlercreutzia caecimuris]|uniref:hypothetical protein n=1 Tax=Adlercreutzia caecimuris TaxID=671266 RepID=UPI00256FAC52|nr:hypothetical protein [Adlercreutzia caecimuris]